MRPAPDDAVTCRAEPRRLRYLRYDEQHPHAAGLGHQVINLECLLREACGAGRLAVLPPLRLIARHNFGLRNEWKWDSYFDLDRTRLVDVAGTEYPLPLTSNGPEAGVSTFTVGPGERTPRVARDHVLLVRRITSGWFRDSVPEEEEAPVRLRLRSSRRVRQLARPVVSDLLARGEGRFVAVHARRGDRLHQYPGRLTEPAGIRSHLKDRGVPDGSLVFLMSDERDPAFWEPLTNYEIARYTEYPELAALVRRDDGRRPDNYMLYTVEREVMASAWMRIETVPLPNFRTAEPHSSLVDERTWKKFLRRRRSPVRRAGRRLWNLACRIGRRLRGGRQSRRS